MVATGIGSVGGGREELVTATNGSHIWESVFQIDGVSLAGPDGSARRLVLKRWLRPGWEVDDARYTAAREAEVLRRLAPTPVPVPLVVALDEDGAEAGAPAILMTHVEGLHPSLAD